MIDTTRISDDDFAQMLSLRTIAETTDDTLFEAQQASALAARHLSRLQTTLARKYQLKGSDGIDAFGNITRSPA